MAEEDVTGAAAVLNGAVPHAGNIRQSVPESNPRTFAEFVK